MSTVGITGTEPDPREVYADIIDLPHHQSATRPHMSLHDRAAQFMPFAALSGYEDMVQERARETEQQIVLDESALERLDRKLQIISCAIEDRLQPVVTITYFEPDPCKEGGSYRTAEEEILRVSSQKRELVLARTEGRTGKNAVIPLDSIAELHGALVDSVEDEIL